MIQPWWALLRRETQRFWRIKGQTVVTPMINATLYLLIFGISIGSQLSEEGGLPYLLFLIPGLVMMAVLNNSFQNAAGTLLVSKYHGDLQDLRTTPLSSHDIVWGLVLASALRGIVVGIAVGIIGEIFAVTYLHQSMPLAHPEWALFFLVGAGISFGQLGIAVGFITSSWDQMNSFTSYLLLPLIYLGGVFFSLEGLPHFWQVISHFNPLFYLINGLRYSILGEADIHLWIAIGATLLCCLVSTLLCYWSLRCGSHYRL